MAVDLLTEMTTKGLMVGWCVYQHGYTGQRDESCPGADRAGWHKISSYYEECCSI